ncbi:MAG: pyridoxal phosphate-dependent aminotransferase [Candidatus Aenigmatarchaeota archaeon]
MPELAFRTKVVGPSKIEESLRIMEQRKDIISLGAGEPDFPAPKVVVDAANKFLKKGFTHYAPLQGKKELREAISEKLKKENKIDATPDEIIITTGSKEAILLSVLTLVNPKEEVIIPNPGYLAYRPVVEMLGGIPVDLKLREEDGFEVNCEELKKLISKKTKLLIINTPSNPTGNVLNKKTLEEIADIVVDKDIFVLVDEAYEKLTYENTKHISLASLNGMFDYAITTQTFSKSYAMCGFRVGYAVAKKEIIKEMKEFKLATTISAPTAYQLAAVEALKKCRNYVEKMRKEYDRRRKMICKRLSEIPGVRFNMPKGAFYVFPNIEAFNMRSKKFVDFIFEKAKVIIVAGTEFGKYGEGFVRLSYATAYEKIEEAMNRIEKVLKS